VNAGTWLKEWKPCASAGATQKPDATIQRAQKNIALPIGAGRCAI